MYLFLSASTPSRTLLNSDLALWNLRQGEKKRSEINHRIRIMTEEKAKVDATVGGQN